MKINLYDRVILKDGRKASIVEILEEGVAYIADVDLPGQDWDTVEIKYEDIISWKMEAKQYLEQKAIEKRAKETALRLLRAGMDPAATQASIKEWFCVDLSDSAFEYLVGQVEIEKNFSKIADAIEGRPGNVNQKNE